jgi:hypothetical protein
MKFKVNKYYQSPSNRPDWPKHILFVYYVDEAGVDFYMPATGLFSRHLHTNIIFFEKLMNGPYREISSLEEVLYEL